MGNGDDAHYLCFTFTEIGQSPSGLLKGSWVMGWFRDATVVKNQLLWGHFMVTMEKIPTQI